MKFLVDANLPPALCGWLAAREHGASAVRDIGMRDAEDSLIWDWALKDNAIILTKDEDFAERRSRSATGPQIVWVRIGNAITSILFARLAGVWNRVERDLAEGAAIVEIR